MTNIARISVVYQHLSYQSNYTVGNTVSKGDVIGVSGSTGNVTGSHLHFTVLSYEGQPVNELLLYKTMNPLMFYSISDFTFSN